MDNIEKLETAFNLLQQLEIPSTIGNMSRLMAAQKHIKDVYTSMRGEMTDDKRHSDAGRDGTAQC